MLKTIIDKNEWEITLSFMKYDSYHTWDYHQIAFENGEGDPVLFLYESGNVKISLPLLIRKIDDVWIDATSVYGYPGIIETENTTPSHLEQFFLELTQWAEINNCVSIFSRLNSIVSLTNHESFHSIYNAGETVKIDLTVSLERQRASYRKNYRNLVKRLVKDGYSCSWSRSDDDLFEFINIYNNTMRNLGASDFYFFDINYYQAIMKSSEFETRIYSCFLNGERVCSGLFVFCCDVVQYHLGGTVDSFKHSAPTRLMIDTVRVDATNLGYTTFHLGGGLSGKRDSLFEFKYGFSKDAINFNVLKLITNPSKYASLSGACYSESNDLSEGFFPLYRDI